METREAKPEDFVIVGLDTRDGPEHALYDGRDDVDEELAAAVGEGKCESVGVRMMNGRMEVVSGADIVRAGRLWNEANSDNRCMLEWHLAAMPYEIHPYAKLFPALAVDERQELARSIERDGYDPTFPVTLYQGRILDGRNRYQCAVQCGAEPAFVDFQGSDEDALAFVLRANLTRRHLSTSQRAAIAAELATLPRGRPSDNPQTCGVSQAEAAAKMNVSERIVTQAVAVRNADPALHESVKAGETSVNSAALMVRAFQAPPIAAARPNAPQGMLRPPPRPSELPLKGGVPCSDPPRAGLSVAPAPRERPPKRPTPAEIRSAIDDDDIADDAMTWRAFGQWVLGEREGLIGE